MEIKKVETIYENKRIEIVEINGKRFVRRLEDGKVVVTEKL